MATTFRLGSLGATTNAIGVPNQGLSRYAQARLDNTVARAVRRHQEAMRVDGVEIYIWRRQFGGLICTCRQPAKPLSREQQIAEEINPTPDQLRQSRLEVTEVPAGGETGDISFKIYHLRGQPSVPLPSQPLPADFVGLNDPDAADNGLDGEAATDPLNSLAPLDQATNDVSDEELARMLSDGGALFGGDKTACGICFGTGRTHGYGLVNGRRMVLDASNEWLFTLNGNAEAQYNKFPTQFRLDSNPQASVAWTVDLPSYTNGWLAIAVRNNLRPANNLMVQWLRGGVWQPLTLTALAASDGSDRRGSKIRVTSDGAPNIGEDLLFTHVEISYASAPPVRAAMPSLNIPTNFDVFQPTITSEFEVMGMLNSLPRESIFTDTKFKLLWKVIDSTQKMTATGQVFGYTINARTVHSSEMYYALRLLTDPTAVVNYRGLERTEGGLTQQYWPDSTEVPNDFTFPETAADTYDTEES